MNEWFIIEPGLKYSIDKKGPTSTLTSWASLGTKEVQSFLIMTHQIDGKDVKV